METTSGSVALLLPSLVRVRNWRRVPVVNLLSQFFLIIQCQRTLGRGRGRGCSPGTFATGSKRPEVSRCSPFLVMGRTFGSHMFFLCLLVGRKESFHCLDTMQREPGCVIHWLYLPAWCISLPWHGFLAFLSVLPAYHRVLF